MTLLCFLAIANVASASLPGLGDDLANVDVQLLQATLNVETKPVVAMENKMQASSLVQKEDATQMEKSNHVEASQASKVTDKTKSSPQPPAGFELAGSDGMCTNASLMVALDAEIEIRGSRSHQASVQACASHCFGDSECQGFSYWDQSYASAHDRTVQGHCRKYRSCTNMAACGNHEYRGSFSFRKMGLKMIVRSGATILQRASTTIRRTGSDQCADDGNNHMWTCHPGAWAQGYNFQQRGWTYTANGQVRDAQGRCMSAEARRGFYPRSWVTCSNDANQQWTITSFCADQGNNHMWDCDTSNDAMKLDGQALGYTYDAQSLQVRNSAGLCMRGFEERGSQRSWVACSRTRDTEWILLSQCADGGNNHMWDCDSDSNAQKFNLGELGWSYNASSLQITNSAGQCMRGEATRGTMRSFVACSSSDANQKWELVDELSEQWGNAVGGPLGCAQTNGAAASSA